MDYQFTHTHNDKQLINRRLWAAGLISLMFFMILIGQLVFLQIVNHDHFNTLSQHNRIDIEPIPPQRGRIYDRNGLLLADNIPTFSLELIPEKTESLEEDLSDLAKLFSLSSERLDEIKQQIKRQRRFQEVVIKQRMNEEEVARFFVNRHRFEGADVVARSLRYYPYGSLFAHTVGYIGRINEADMKRIDVKAYKGTSHIGKTGLERYYEDILHGKAGYQQVETNVRGRVVREVSRQAAESGKDLFLHVDVPLQQEAVKALTGYNGAIVVMDPRNQGVLALVSQPDFDPNAFVSGISYKSYGALRDSPDRPLFNRSIRGSYPPGSTLKPFVALAGLESGVVQSYDSVFCPGWYSLPGKAHRYRCWNKRGHGHMGLTQSLGQSCDVYYYDLAVNLGIDRLHSFLDHFDFGKRTGIDVAGESGGLSPSREWKERVRKQVWFPGETLISGIGQGFNLTTPIQLAHATAILAMGGEVQSPRVVKALRAVGESAPEPLPALEKTQVPVVDVENWEKVIGGMTEVMHGPRGTARKTAKGLPFKIAGKTGTAQVFNIKQNERYNAAELDKRLHDHALFIAIAPVENPEIVIAVVVENGGGGSSVAAPMARKIIDAYFGFGEPSATVIH